MKAWWRGSRRSGRGDRRRRCPRVLVTLASTDDGDGTGLFDSPEETNITANTAESSCFIDISNLEEEITDQDVGASGNEGDSAVTNGEEDLPPHGNRPRNILQTQTSVWEDDLSSSTDPLVGEIAKNTDRNFVRDSLSRHGFYIGESSSDLNSLVALEEGSAGDSSVDQSSTPTHVPRDESSDAQSDKKIHDNLPNETEPRYVMPRPRSYTDSISQCLVDRRNLKDSYTKLISPDPQYSSLERMSGNANLTSEMEEGKIPTNSGCNVGKPSTPANGDPVGPGRNKETSDQMVTDQSSTKGLPSRRLSPKGLTKLKMPPSLDHLDVAMPNVPHTAPASSRKLLPQMLLSPNLTPPEESSGVTSREGRKFSFPILRRHSHTVKSF